MPKTTFGEDKGLERARDLAHRQETQSANDDAASEELRHVRHTLNIDKKHSSSQGIRARQARLTVRKKRAIMAFFGLGAIGIILGISLLSPSLLLVNMKEQLVNDLNDSTLAYYTYARKVMAQQVGGTPCQEKTIHCKFNSMSNMLKERYEERGFTLASTRSSSSDRYSVSSLRTPSGEVATNPGSFLKLMSDDGLSMDRISDVIDPKNALFHDRKFAHRLYERFHISHTQNLSGGSRQDVEESFDQNLWSDNDLLDGYGRGVYGLDYLSQTEGVWRDTVYPKIIEKAKTHLAITCGMHTYASIMEGAVQQAKATTVARFAMQYLATADAVKAGIQMGDHEVEFLSDRLSVDGGGGSTATDGSSYRVPAMYEVPAADQQPHGRSYMNDAKVALDIMRAFGGAFGVPGTTYLKNASTSMQGTTPGRDACVKGLSTAQQASEQGGSCLSPGIESLARYIGPVGFAATQVPQFTNLIRGLCVADYGAVVELAKNLTRPEASFATSTLIGPALRQEYNRFNSQTHGVAAQDAVFAGAGIILGDVAQSVGMRPASRDSLRSYLAATNEVYDEMIRSERIAARNTPWDLANRYSFAGSVLQNIGGVNLLQQTSSVGAGATLISTLLPRAAISLTSPVASALYSQPANRHWERLLSASDCHIQGGLDINPDFACNIRYSMSANDLNKDVNAVVEYMSTTQSSGGGVTGDAGADTEVSQRMQAASSEGSSAPYIDPVTGAPNKHTEYAKFLEYCTNRTLPWGYVGLQTEHVPEAYSPDEDMSPRGVRTYSHKNYDIIGNSTASTAPPELPWAYYGLAWGTDDDQEWMSGKKCLEESTMLNNFRAYTVMCRALAGMSGSRECWHEDATPDFNSGFYPRNNIIFIRE